LRQRTEHGRRDERSRGEHAGTGRDGEASKSSRLLPLFSPIPAAAGRPDSTCGVVGAVTVAISPDDASMPRQGFRTVNPTRHSGEADRRLLRAPSFGAGDALCGCVGADQSLFMFTRPFVSVSHIGVASSWLTNCGFGCSVSSSVQKRSNDHC
jgi:hypothetical protein